MLHAICNPLDFLHFRHEDSPGQDHQNAVVDEELEFCGDEVDWNANSNTIDWSSPTPAHNEPAMDTHEVAAAPPPPSELVHKTSAYDTRSVVPTHASYAVPTAFQPMTMMPNKVHTSSIVPILADGEKSHGVHPKNNAIFSRTKSRRNMILCLSIVSLLSIPLLIMASLGVFDKDTSTPAPPIDNSTNVVGSDTGSNNDDADDDVVSLLDDIHIHMISF